MQINDIIKGCKKGDRKAQKELYMLTAKDVFNVCCRYMRSTEKARDMMQDTFVVALQKMDKYQSIKGSIGAWICRIATNLCIDNLRRTKKIVFVEELSDTLLVVDDTSIVDQLNAEELMLMVEKLPEHHRIVFNLFIVEGYSHQEIAEKLKIKEATSRSHLLRARGKLQNMIKKQINLESRGSPPTANQNPNILKATAVNVSDLSIMNPNISTYGTAR